MTARDHHELLGQSPVMERIRRFARRAGRTAVPVLITGETGTGKTLLARIIHEQGQRRRAPFIPVNCAGLPEGLFESEFFGHRRGAFTGAVDHRRGLIEAAHEGTLFLDEVADLPLSQQAKLLTVIEDRQVRRIGEERPVEVDVRLISATSVDVPSALADGRFRPDLYHRVALLRCTLPPLRERPEDILFMAEALLNDLARKHGHERPHLSPAVRALLAAHAWPGNVRELSHVLEAALILSDGALLDPLHIREVMEFTTPAGAPGVGREAAVSGSTPTSGPPAGPGSPVPSDATPGADSTRGRGGHTGGEITRGDIRGGGVSRGDLCGAAVAPSERDRIREALERHAGDRTRAAHELGMSRTTLRSRIVRYGLNPAG